MFKKRSPDTPSLITPSPTPVERVTSVLGSGITVKGGLSGSGGLRIEGALEGDIALRGLLVIGETGRVTCQELRANSVIVAGAVRGDITAEKVEIRSTGRVWGNVVTASFATEEGAFLQRPDSHGRAGRHRCSSCSRACIPLWKSRRKRKTSSPALSLIALQNTQIP
jgi:cytoskeletal protein CcmA (bactofilin family)